MVRAKKALKASSPTSNVGSQASLTYITCHILRSSLTHSNSDVRSEWPDIGSTDCFQCRCAPSPLKLGYLSLNSKAPSSPRMVCSWSSRLNVLASGVSLFLATSSAAKYPPFRRSRDGRTWRKTSFQPSPAASVDKRHGSGSGSSFGGCLPPLLAHCRAAFWMLAVQQARLPPGRSAHSSASPPQIPHAAGQQDVRSSLTMPPAAKQAPSPELAPPSETVVPGGVQPTWAGSTQQYERSGQASCEGQRPCAQSPGLSENILKHGQNMAKIWQNMVKFP